MLFIHIRLNIAILKSIKNYLDTKSIPDPDLIIRTSGEQRLSNFLMWEAAYSEFYFTDNTGQTLIEQSFKRQYMYIKIETEDLAD